MNHDDVETLEREIEEAISATCRRLWKKPHMARLEPRDERIYHLMAKAAVTVLEAAASDE